MPLSHEAFPYTPDHIGLQRPNPCVRGPPPSLGTLLPLPFAARPLVTWLHCMGPLLAVASGTQGAINIC